MGYAYYEVSHAVTGEMMIRGYSVMDVCNHLVPRCGTIIDRGLSYLCYRCTSYFCYEHMATAFDPTNHDELIEATCFAGTSTQICVACCKELERPIEI